MSAGCNCKRVNFPTDGLKRCTFPFIKKISISQPFANFTKTFTFGIFFTKAAEFMDFVNLVA